MGKRVVLKGSSIATSPEGRFQEEEGQHNRKG